jgi:aminomethyltransferase
MAHRRTPLFPWHQAHGATFAAFGGFDMPLWYQSAKDEHLAVLTHVGLFDTSHMSALRVTGPGALELLQFCFTNDLAACLGSARKPLEPGRCIYGAFLDARGHVLDDAICFMLAPADYLVVVNAGMGAPITAHLENQRGERHARVRNLDGAFGKLDVQGPEAARVLSAVLAAPAKALSGLPYFAFKGGFGGLASATAAVTLRDGTPLLLSRTGYTGEFGFELFTTAEAIADVWETLHAAAAERGGRACGLAARDSLRAGAVLPLSHQDIGNWPFVHHPWPFALPWTPDGRGLRKPFLGAEALLAAEAAPHTHAFVGQDLRKVSAPATVHDGQGAPLGQVLTCVTDMGIGWREGRLVSIASPDRPPDFLPRGLACGFVRVDRPLAPGTPVELRDTRRRLPATIVEDIRPDRTARRPIKDML